MTTLTRVNWPEAEAQLQTLLKQAPHGTKGALAEKFGMTPTHLSQLASGKRRMTREVAEMIADHYGLFIDYTVKPKGGAQ